MPSAPNIPVKVSQSPSLIKISWNIPNDGGSILLGYVVFSDGGISSFAPLSPTITNGLTVNYSITAADYGIAPGVVYQLRVVAYNIIGDSSPSPSIAIMAATIPDAPINLVQIASSSVSITFGWSAPVYNGGTSITDYKVYWNEGIDYNPFV